MTSDKKLTVVSLFSGCGGMDLGFRGGFISLSKKYDSTGYDIIWANDIDKPSCKTYKNNFPRTEVIPGDIGEVLHSLFDIPQADIVLGGFPCQDFSLAGKRRGLTVKRGRLYSSMVEVVKRLKPKAFVAENVKGLLNWMGGLAIETIKKDFEDQGYDTTINLVNAADYGVPQKRERVFIVGIRKDLGRSFKLPATTHAEKPMNAHLPWVTLEQAIGDLENDKLHFSLPNSGYSKARLFPGTQGNVKTKAERPGPTMRAEHHGNIEWHYSKDRRLSAREAARIQSFPDDFIFFNSTSDAYRQIGNAVPPVLAWNIARRLREVLE